MSGEKYVLATGEEAEYRLRVVQNVHGADTRAFLGRAGVMVGMRVADIGCGTGPISCWLAGQIGSSGEVIGVDAGGAQLVVARKAAEQARVSNARFVEASAYDTGLERGAFDMVYSRFMLMFLQRPEEALAEMHAMLKPNGIIAVEDGDFEAPFCYPPSDAYDECFRLYRAVGAAHGADFLIGRKLYGLVRAAGFRDLHVSLVQPVVVRGDAKRLPEWTIAEAAPRLIEAELTSENELDALVRDLAELAADEGTMFGMARMTQIWARK